MTEQFLGGEAFRESTDLEEKETHSVPRPASTRMGPGMLRCGGGRGRGHAHGHCSLRKKATAPPSVIRKSEH